MKNNNEKEKEESKEKEGGGREEEKRSVYRKDLYTFMSRAWKVGLSRRSGDGDAHACDGGGRVTSKTKCVVS